MLGNDQNCCKLKLIAINKQYYSLKYSPYIVHERITVLDDKIKQVGRLKADLDKIKHMNKKNRKFTQ